MPSGYVRVSNTVYLLQTRTSSSSNVLLSGSQYLFVLAQQMRHRPFTPDGAYYQQWEEIDALTPVLVFGKESYVQNWCNLRLLPALCIGIA
jgi:hypothetical protein